ncbi:LysR family transcriptional regulator [Peterkaempfera griseoplana]|uniref:LysR family transcriptional regulator n=1 Tax=Peterkaempfera griseoplana TaxID=66896 RepID=UPI0006E15D07|nr:LysR family transcriptional regulator [Peterkaempfera griseoplana]
MPVTLAQLRALVAVIDQQGFAPAAHKLGISQSAVSHSVATLEKTLGAPVIHRDTPPPRATPLGALMLPHARQAIDSVDMLTSLAATFTTHAQGTVRLGAPPTVCRGLMPDCVALWRTEHPNIDIVVLEGEDNEVAGWLEAGTVDMAVLVDPDPIPAGAVPFLHDDFRVALPCDHPLANEPEVELADLDDDTMLLSDGGVEKYLKEMHRLAGRRYTPLPRVRGFATVLDMVRSRVGIAVVPGLAQLMMPPGTVLTRLRPRVHRDLYLTGPASGMWLPAAHALIQTLTASLPLDPDSPRLR